MWPSLFTVSSCQPVLSARRDETPRSLLYTFNLDTLFPIFSDEVRATSVLVSF